MKTNLILLAILLSISTCAYAQYKEFSTFLAIEDAAGRKDTIWYSTNINASNDEPDENLGEVEVNQPIDSNLFFITTIDHIDFNPLFISNKIVNRAVTINDIYVIIVFINAKFPVKIKMDRAFIDTSNEFDYRYTNYFITYCQWPFLMDWPLMWYDAEGFECLLNEFVYIEDPRTKKAEYSCDNHYVYEIDVKDKGIQTFYGVGIATITLDDHCYSQLRTDRSIMEERIIIAPNPVCDYLRIRLDRGSQLQYTIEDMAGRCIRKGVSEYDGSIEVSTMTRGIYVISLTDSRHKTFRQKFIKM